MATPGIAVVGLAEFRRALKDSVDATPRELTSALKAAGTPVVERARSLAPVRTGRLASGYRASVSGTTGRIGNTAPYVGGSEWGTRGKWRGFLRYGGPGRFASRALDEKAEQVQDLVTSGLETIIEIHGWGHG